jgi:hypothetical protein
VRRAAVAAFVALVLAPVAHARPWTPTQARAALAHGIVHVEDDAQTDRPVFDLSFPDGGTMTRLGPGRFRYSGPARDVDRGVAFPVTLTFVPDGSGVDVTSFRGPPPDTSQPSLPLRLAFYYGWFPEVWFDTATFPFSRYDPLPGGYYDSADARLLSTQIAAMQYGKIGAGIWSWWGRGTPTDLRFPVALAMARQTSFRWAVYYEPEGYGDPSPPQIRSDLEYIRDTYASNPSYLRIDGRFVVFAYGGRESCSVADRWTQAAQGLGAYIVLPAFDGFRDCASQPDSWHFYSASIAEFELHGYSFGVCPGFWRIDEPQPRLVRDEPQPRLVRDVQRFAQDVRDMVASHEPLQLVLTFNEWGEGTAVEDATAWQSASGFGQYLDVLHDDGSG